MEFLVKLGSRLANRYAFAVSLILLLGLAYAYLTGLSPAGRADLLVKLRELLPLVMFLTLGVLLFSGYQVHYTYAETEATQFGVMAEMASKHKVQIKRWSDKDLAVFEKAWLEVLREESAKDPLFKKIADDYLAFRKNYARWGDSQYMKASYLPAKK